jgi:hypothetical protein
MKSIGCTKTREERFVKVEHEVNFRVGDNGTSRDSLMAMLSVLPRDAVIKGVDEQCFDEDIATITFETEQDDIDSSPFDDDWIEREKEKVEAAGVGHIFCGR